MIGKPGHKGGNIRFNRAINDVGQFLKQQSDIYVSTMFDYFRIDAAWPGLADVHQQLKKGKQLAANEKAEIIEEATLKEIENAFSAINAGKRFMPYIEMHEFESLLFSAPEILSNKTGIDLSLIDEIVSAFKNPEEINDDPEKTPSKRMMKLMSPYRKAALGKTISEAIGIKTIRRKCPHFHSWLKNWKN